MGALMFVVVTGAGADCVRSVSPTQLSSMIPGTACIRLRTEVIICSLNRSFSHFLFVCFSAAEQEAQDLREEIAILRGDDIAGECLRRSACLCACVCCCGACSHPSGPVVKRLSQSRVQLHMPLLNFDVTQP